MTLNRRDVLFLAGVAGVAGSMGLPSLALAKDGDTIDQLKLMAPNGIPDKVDGDPNAKVTVIEYASPTCPHCAWFSNNVVQPFREKYVTTGKVKFIIRPFARNTMDAAIFLLAEAAAMSTDGKTAPAADASSASLASVAPADASNPSGYSQAAIGAYENVLATFYRTQDTWGVSEKPLDAMKAVASQLGFSDDAFNAALTNQDLFNKISSMRDQALNDFGLEGTPTFYINGKAASGQKTLDEMSALVDPLLA